MSSDYPSDWDSRRKKVYKRDDYTCQNCKRKGGSNNGAELHAHHVVPKSKNGSHDLSNLITVCMDCHSAIHGRGNAPSEESSNDSVFSIPWTDFHSPPDFVACPSCGTLNISGDGLKVRRSTQISGRYNNSGYIIECNSCSLELHAITPSRSIVVSGIEELEGESLRNNQLDRIAKTIRQKGNSKLVVNHILKEIKIKTVKIYAIAVACGFVAFILLYIAVNHDQEPIALIALPLSIVGLILLDLKDHLDI